MDVVHRIESYGSASGTPLTHVEITNSGELITKTSPKLIINETFSDFEYWSQSTDVQDSITISRYENNSKIFDKRNYRHSILVNMSYTNLDSCYHSEIISNDVFRSSLLGTPSFEFWMGFSTYLPLNSKNNLSGRMLHNFRIFFAESEIFSLHIAKDMINAMVMKIFNFYMYEKKFKFTNII